ncbi:hypothetical protein ACIG0D_27165 [Streptomyces sp. NPDC052773]|uniref:hypothetical protein n=1 Tax=Streptomyces sp. NPDC052773 TaxID=3365693 RepID=UPI0037D4E99C
MLARLSLLAALALRSGGSGRSGFALRSGRSGLAGLAVGAVRAWGSICSGLPRWAWLTGPTVFACFAWPAG